MTNLTRTLAALAVTATALLATTGVSAADCIAPQGVAAERACAKAAEGATELRRFTERTQPIYNLSYADYASNVAGASVAAAKADGEKPVQVATR